MKNHFKETPVKNLFEVQSGDCHATSELGAGDIPLISCGDVGNGLVGYFDIPDEWIHSRAITVAYNGSWPLTAKFHPYRFGAKDDVAVLVPLQPMKDSVMLYVAALLNRLIWRYSYGRKCFKGKLRQVSLLMPVDDQLPDDLFQKALKRVSDSTLKATQELFREN